MMTALSGGAPEQAPRWDLVDTKSCGGGIRFLAPYLIVWGDLGIYRRKEDVGGAKGGPRGRGRALGGAPSTLVAASLLLDVESKSRGSCSVRKSRSRRFHS